eukprot:841599-Ditylum_brightwellii.AAC.1
MTKKRIKDTALQQQQIKKQTKKQIKEPALQQQQIKTANQEINQGTSTATTTNQDNHKETVENNTPASPEIPMQPLA